MPQTARQPDTLSRGICSEQQTPCVGDTGQTGEGKQTQSDRGGPGTNPRRATGIDEPGAPKAGPWKGRLKRVFNIDIETCRECCGAVWIMPKALAALAGQALACIEDAAVIEKILTHFQGKDTSVSTSLRHYNPPRAKFLLAAFAQ